MHPIIEASHRLCEALHNSNIDPSAVEIHLPRDEWWRLWNKLDHIYRGFMTFDGRGITPGRFQHMGIVYVAKPDAR